MKLILIIKRRVTVKRNRTFVALSFSFLVFGFVVSFSYQSMKEEQPIDELKNEQWQKEYEERELLIKQEKKNKELEKELIEKQKEVKDIEDTLKDEEKLYYNLVEEVERYRMYLGDIAVTGQGVKVTLEDSSYIPEGDNVNNYIVHEGHIFQVINELIISGANAVSVNGQRIVHDSYLFCNGPVVTIDGNQYSAPFTISAIGDVETLDAALEISGGVVDQLTYDNIAVKVEQVKEVHMNPVENRN
ncbi:DUF881 domain-containing protein [Bacillus carboniphilus]|uniref:DUF881 domain-containing protein n=1 Tax=Bacillus carboniphilus TaxID=86663 RepID=A0ABY9K148_9BACI|nr:DUF881 domain-containing protein [Bacillus carboniphilus]WLR43621.1 DUF881 domain-containing protein [Bacillus carboniphilus]